jgi:type IV pilus biogenesis/stability protein PilW
MKRMNRCLILLLTVVVLVFGAWNCSSKKKSGVPYPRQLKPGTPEFYVNEAIFYLNGGDIKAAEERFQKALKKKPTMITAINGMGIVMLNKREFQKAKDYFRQVVRLSPKYYDAYNYLGVVYLEMKEYDLAKENLLIAANAPKYRTPENAFVNLGWLEVRQERYDAAQRYVEKGLKENGRFSPLLNLMGVIYENKKEYLKALEWYQLALSTLTEEDVSYLVNIGRVYIKLKQKAKALDILERALPKAFNPELKKQVRDMLKEAEEL